jgi:hypothetical protein
MEEVLDTHCLVLRPIQQVVLRCLLFNTLSGYIDRTITRLEIGEDVTDNYMPKSEVVLHMFNRYNDFLDLLCTRDNWYKKGNKTKMFLVKEPMMKIIQTAVEEYNFSANYLSKDDGDLVERYFNDIKEYINKTAKYMYTSEEIEKIQREEFK